MAKRLRKQTCWSNNDSTGCMWGLINMLDFRQGQSTPRLISNKKQGTGKHFGTKHSSEPKLLSNVEETEERNVVDKSEGQIVKVGMMSVRSLMEEEMSGGHPKKTIPCEELQVELGLEAYTQKSYEKTAENCELIKCDAKTSKISDTHQSNYTNPVERVKFDIATLLNRYYTDRHQCQVKHMDVGLVSKTNDPRTLNHLDEPGFKLAEKESILHKALSNITDAFPSEKFNGKEHLNGAVQSKEVMDLLEIMISNKDISILLQDPGSPLFGHIQDHQNAKYGKLPKLELCKCAETSTLLEEVGSSGQSEERINRKYFSKQNGYNFFRKKGKSKEEKALNRDNGLHDLNRIVILKPSSSVVGSSSNETCPSSSGQPNHGLNYHEDGERVGSHFSLKEIKRRLKHVIGERGKARDAIYLDHIQHRVPYGDLNDTCKQLTRNNSVKDLANYIVCKREKHVKLELHQQNVNHESPSVEVCNKERLSILATADTLNMEYLCEEAKKHLIETQDAENDNNNCSTRKLNSLETLLSLPKCDLVTTTLSSGRDTTADLSPLRQYSHVNETECSSPLVDDFQKRSCTDAKREIDAQVIDSDTMLVDSHVEEICIGEAMYFGKGGTEVVEIADIACHEECEQLDIHLKSDGNELVLSDEKLPSSPSGSISSNILLLRKAKSTLEKSEQPNPISVLEPLFADDVNSPMDRCDVFSVHPERIQFEKFENPAFDPISSDSDTNLLTSQNDIRDKYDFVKIILEVSGLSCNESSHGWFASAQLVYPSFPDEVGTSFSQLPTDPKLLFDCTCEAFTEIQERFFGCTMRVSFINPHARPIPVGGKIIEEVCKGIDRHVKWQAPRTLDEIIRIDMDGVSWLDHISEAESIIVEMEDYILGELIEEAALDMWL